MLLDTRLSGSIRMFRDKRVTDPESGHERWLYDRRWRHFLRFSRMDTRKRYGSDREFGRKVAEMVQALEWSGALTRAITPS